MEQTRFTYMNNHDSVEDIVVLGVADGVHRAECRRSPCLLIGRGELPHTPISSIFLTNSSP